MPKPLTPAKRAAIVTDIKAGKPRNQIARDHHVSAGAVTNIAKAEHLTFDRSHTQEATRAKELDAKALRAQLALDLLGDAQRFRARAWGPYKVVVGTSEGAEVVTLDLPPLPDQRAAYTAIGISVDKSVRIEQHDSDEVNGLAAVDEWLRGMMGEQR